MKINQIAILGGAGFVGKHLVTRLFDKGYSVRVLTRSRNQHKELFVLPQLEIIEVDIHDLSALISATHNCDALINLVGILNEKNDDGSGFRHAHLELAEKIVKACQTNSIKRLLQMSALNAGPEGPSHYLKSKGAAEAVVMQANSENLAVTCFRPSVIFGTDDSFFNRFAGLLRIAPYIFPLACPEARFAPVYVSDVVDAFVQALTNAGTIGKCYDLCGPKQYTLMELVEYTRLCLGLQRKIIPLTKEMSQTQAGIMEFVPGKPFSLDNFRSLQVDSVCHCGNGLLDLGIPPTSLETVVPRYLENKTIRGRYHSYRHRARR